MHPEADAFLDAIFDHPDDDTHRLVYADWLEEHGQENYAQFIRLQCAAAREKLWSDESNRLWEEIGRVWTKLDEEWWPATRDDWPQTSGYSLDAIDFHRGFLREECYLTYSQLVRYSDTCWPWLPLPVTVITPDSDYHKPDVATLARLSRIRHLQIVDHNADEEIWTLIHSPLLTNLEVLDMTAALIASNEIERLLIPQVLPQLRQLRLRVYDEEWHTTVRLARSLASSMGEPEPLDLPPFIPELRKQLEARFEKVMLAPYE